MASFGVIAGKELSGIGDHGCLGSEPVRALIAEACSCLNIGPGSDAKRFFSYFCGKSDLSFPANFKGQAFL